MTREEAISYLRRYRRNEVYKPSKNLFGWRRNYYFDEAVYTRFLILELIDRINSSTKDPIETIRDFYYWMDDMMCGSEQNRTWAFSSCMENASRDIIRYLRAKEKNEDASN